MKTTHYKQRMRFELRGDNGRVRGFIEYTQGKNGQLRAEHTVVSKKYEGQGYGGLLVDALAAYARENQQTIDPVCPYVRALRQRQPEKYEDVIII